MVASHRLAPVFKNPVTKDDAPDYDDVVKRKMDLTTIKKHLDDGVYFCSLFSFTM